VPALSRRARIARLQNELLSSSRYCNALLVVVDHEGNEIFREGGRWDRYTQRYVDGECEPFVVKLQESQTEIAKAFAEWLRASKANEPRTRAIIGGGDRGSGKTWFLGGLSIIAIALAFPGEWQLAVNLTAKQRRECIDSIKAASRPEWISQEVDDFRDPMTTFVTGNMVQWLSARNPGALRQAGLKIRNVFINEGQDQPEIVFVNGIAAVRNTGGLVSIATNRPRNDAGDWIAVLWMGIEAKELNGLAFILDPKKNRAVDQDAQADIRAFLFAVNSEAAAADMGGGAFRLSGPTAYPSFKALPVDRGGHVGVPPQVGWTDVTLELTAAILGGGIGFPYVCGVDFQREPGVIGALAKIYRTEQRKLVLYIFDQVGVKGVELAFSQALYAAGYRPTHGMGGAPILLIGDGTGDRQNANHNWSEPTSFRALQSDGWKIVGPDRHWKHGIPWNPPVRLSRAQMYDLFVANQILIAPKCKEAVEGFPSLVDSFRRAQVGPKGGLVEKGHFQHGCDGPRYLAWCFLPRPQVQVQQSANLDVQSFEALLHARMPLGR